MTSSKSWLCTSKAGSAFEKFIRYLRRGPVEVILGRLPRRNDPCMGTDALIPSDFCRAGQNLSKLERYYHKQRNSGESASQLKKISSRCANNMTRSKFGPEQRFLRFTEK